jgi:hypothetical protein
MDVDFWVDLKPTGATLCTGNIQRRHAGFVLKKQKKIPGLFQDWLKQIPGPKIYDIMS